VLLINTVIAEVQGEAPKTSYLFHANLTPDLLTADQAAQLPTLSQKKYTKLIAPCAQEQQALEAKKELLCLVNSNKNSGGNKRGVGISHPNNTHLTTGTSEPTNNNSGGKFDNKQDVVAWSMKCFLKKWRCGWHNATTARVFEKIAYLASLRKQNPSGQKTPRRLRRAIEEITPPRWLPRARRPPSPVLLSGGRR
jgi:hypothetical protein